MCFEKFELSDTIDGALDGNALNLIRPNNLGISSSSSSSSSSANSKLAIGWHGMGLFFASVILFKLFSIAAKKRAQAVEDKHERDQRHHGIDTTSAA